MTSLTYLVLLGAAYTGVNKIIAASNMERNDLKNFICVLLHFYFSMNPISALGIINPLLLFASII
jgi:hypothetical protein